MGHDSALAVTVAGASSQNAETGTEMVVHKAKRLPSGLHLYNCITGARNAQLLYHYCMRVSVFTAMNSQLCTSILYMYCVMEICM